MKAPMKKGGGKNAMMGGLSPMVAQAGNAMSDEEMKYRAQDALHTLRRADEIKQDPHLMKHVKHHAKQERAHLTRVLRRK